MKYQVNEISGGYAVERGTWQDRERGAPMLLVQADFELARLHYKDLTKSVRFEAEAMRKAEKIAVQVCEVLNNAL